MLRRKFFTESNLVGSKVSEDSHEKNTTTLVPQERQILGSKHKSCFWIRKGIITDDDSDSDEVSKLEKNGKKSHT